MSAEEKTGGGRAAGPAPLRRRVRLRQLELLAALEHAPTLSVAAREVHLSQPAASKLLNAIAEDLGIELFERAGRALRPTSAGRLLIGRAARLIGDLDRAQAELAAIRDGRAGSATLGAGVGACHALVPRAMALLLEQAPGLGLALREGTMEELIALLREGRLDMVVGRVEPALLDGELEIEELYDPPVRIVCGPRHPLARARRVDWAALGAQEWILPQAGTPMRAWLERAFRRARARPARACLESSSIPANVLLLGKRDMVWPLSADVAAGYAAAGMLRILPVPGLQVSGPLTILRPRGRSLAPAPLRLLECLREAARGIRQDLARAGRR